MTWSKSKTKFKDEVYQKLLPAGTKLFGGRGLHQDSTPYYHAMCYFAENKHWSDARKYLSIEGIPMLSASRNRSVGHESKVSLRIPWLVVSRMAIHL